MTLTDRDHDLNRDRLACYAVRSEGRLSRRVTHDGKRTLEIRFSFDRGLVDRVKTLPNRRWNSTERFWSAPASDFLRLQPGTLALPLGRPAVDATTTATPLGLAKFEQIVTEVRPLLLGNTAGSLGETAGRLLVACGDEMRVG